MTHQIAFAHRLSAVRPVRSNADARLQVLTAFFGERPTGVGQWQVSSQVPDLVHTTEFNLTSNHRTRKKGNTVIFRRRDIEQIVRRLRDDGHNVEPLDLDVGLNGSDMQFDRLPYSLDRHVKLEWRSYVTTSIGLIIRKSAAAGRPANSANAA